MRGCLLVVVLAVFARAEDSPKEVVKGDQVATKAVGEKALICEQYPNIHLCQLYKMLPSAMEELQYLLELEQSDDNEAMAPAAEKRKSAFVRFGKRKSAFVRFGKRKSALVRFGRSGGDESAEKRKSSYIRFG